MASYKAPDLKERAALAQAAKEKALAQLRAKPAIDPELAARRLAAQQQREADAAEKRRLKREAEKQEKADRHAKAALAAAEKAAEKAPRPVKTDEEQKAARDARYAARKAAK